MAKRFETPYLQDLQFREFAGLTPGEAEAQSNCRNMALRTAEELNSKGSPPGFPFPDSGLFGLQQLRYAKTSISEPCFEEWHGFERAYPALVARNPSLELRDIFQDIAERCGGASWPHGHE